MSGGVEDSVKFGKINKKSSMMKKKIYLLKNIE